MNRINPRVKIRFDEIVDIFNRLLSVEVTNAIFMTDGGSTTNYKVITRKGTFLLKLYPNKRDNTSEITLMQELEHVINIPQIYVYDSSRHLCSTDFLISSFIEGTTFRSYVTKNGMSMKHAKSIGDTLSLIHNKQYSTPHLFDNMDTFVDSIVDQYIYYLDSKASRHIGSMYTSYLENILNEHINELTCVNNHTVRTHGDMNPGNILVDRHNDLWFIDFEYGHATTRYLDFGKFLRKREGYSKHLHQNILDEIRESYQHSLPDNWIHLSMLTDMPAMLRMIDNNSPSMWRVSDIRKKIHDLYNNVDKTTYSSI